MEHRFDITMHVPLGRRHGTVYMTEENSEVCGVLEVLGGRDPFTGTLTEAGELEITGRMRTGLCSFSYTARGTVNGTGLKLNVTGGRYSFCITGEEIKA